ncbi:hypothetical protein [Exiguobacterium sp. CinTr1]|uniref:hypothetical protein n=1 Tax=Exiguobacterium sp. CinTr1 TaxID=2995315 RepID=UPI0022E3DA35|nr:hypothetical protein [Exiguobacterium sp. CinTr1]
MRTQLSSPLASQVKRRIRAIWGVTDSHYWYPLSTAVRPDVIAFDSDYIEEDDQKIKEIQQWILRRGADVVFELHEDLTLWQIDTDSLDPCYDGRYLERYWFDQHMNWVIYASHESTISFAGNELITSLQSSWPDWQEHLSVIDHRFIE